MYGVIIYVKYLSDDLNLRNWRLLHWFTFIIKIVKVLPEVARHFIYRDRIFIFREYHNTHDYGDNQSKKHVDESAFFQTKPLLLFVFFIFI